MRLSFSVGRMGIVKAPTRASQNEKPLPGLRGFSAQVMFVMLLVPPPPPGWPRGATPPALTLEPRPHGRAATS